MRRPADRPRLMIRESPADAEAEARERPRLRQRRDREVAGGVGLPDVALERRTVARAQAERARDVDVEASGDLLHLTVRELHGLGRGGADGEGSGKADDGKTGNERGAHDFLHLR